MKKKLNIILCGGTLLALLLAGCGQQSNQAGYIGVDAAKAIALTSAETSETDAVFTSTLLEERDGTDYYAIDFTAGEISYQYDIDAITGVIIDSSQTENNSASSNASSGTTDSSTQSAQETDTGTSGSTSSTQTDSSSAVITETEAQAIALDHAGLTTDQVTFIKSKLERDDGRQVYDIEFYSNHHEEYDYTIDASTGSVLSVDYDLNGYNIPSDSSSTITADQAKEIALEQVPGATASDIYEFETDYDDGRLEYEGTIWYDGVEYEFTIDGYSGSIREWDVEYKR